MIEAISLSPIIALMANDNWMEFSLRYIVDYRKLQELGESRDMAWKDLKSGVDQVVDDLKRSVKQTISRFKEK